MTSRTPPVLRIRELAPGAYAAGPDVHFRTLKVPADRRIFAFDKAVEWAEEELTRLGEPFWWGFFNELLGDQIAEHGEFSACPEEDQESWIQSALDRIEQSLTPEMEAALGQEFLRSNLLRDATLCDDEQVKSMAWICASWAVDKLWLETQRAPQFLLRVGVNCADIEALMKGLPEEMDLQPEEDNLAMADGGDDEEEFFIEEVWEDPENVGKVSNSRRASSRPSGAAWIDSMSKEEIEVLSDPDGNPNVVDSDGLTWGDDSDEGGAGAYVQEDSDAKEKAGRVLNYHPESESYWVSEEFEPSYDGMAADVTGVPEHEAEFARREAVDLAQEGNGGSAEDDEAAINAAVYEELAKTVSARDEALTAAGVPIPEPKKAARKPRAPKVEKAPKVTAPKETGSAETASRTLLAMKKLRELGVKDEAFAAALGVSRSSANNIVNEARGGKLCGTQQERAAVLAIALDFETEVQRIITLLKTGEYEGDAPTEESLEAEEEGFAEEEEFEGFAEDDEAV